MKHPLLCAAFCAALLGLGLSGAQAQTTAQSAPQPAKFAYQSQAIAASADAAWLRIDLPAAALAQVRQPQADDVFVVDAQGQALPLLLHRPQPASMAGQRSARIAAQSLRDPAPSSAAGGSQASVHIQGAGQVQVQIGADSHAAAPGRHDFVFDTRSLKQNWAALHIEGELPPGEVQNLLLSESSDMQNWRSLTDEARVFLLKAPVDGSGSDIVQRRIELPQPWQPTGRFLKINAADDFFITAIQGELQPTQAAADWRRIPLGAASRGKEGRLWWRLPFALPLHGLELHYDGPESRYFYPYTLRMDRADSQYWQKLDQGAIWRNAEGQTQGRLLWPSGLPSTGHARSLILESSALGDKNLSAHALVQPIEVIAFASGQPPYQVLVGHPNSKKQPLPTAQRLSAAQAQQLGLPNGGQNLPLTLLEAEPARPIATAPPAPPPAGLERPADEDPRQRLLWWVLLAAVGLLALMAFSLWRSMNNKPAA